MPSAWCPAAPSTKRIRIVETTTGTVLPGDLPRTWLGATACSADAKTLLYNQLPTVAPGHEAERELRSNVYRHVLGTSGADSAAFGIDVDPNVAFVPTDFPFIAIPVGSSYALGAISHGVQNELTLYAAPPPAVMDGGRIPWRKIADVDDAVTSFDVHGNTAYLLTHKYAARYKVTALDLAVAAGAPAVVPAGEGAMRVDYDAGHGLLAASRGRTVALQTEEFSFLLWQYGSPEFAGIPLAVSAKDHS